MHFSAIINRVPSQTKDAPAKRRAVVIDDASDDDSSQPEVSQGTPTTSSAEPKLVEAKPVMATRMMNPSHPHLEQKLNRFNYD